jgi:hypothetical protein
LGKPLKSEGKEFRSAPRHLGKELRLRGGESEKPIASVLSGPEDRSLLGQRGGALMKVSGGEARAISAQQDDAGVLILKRLRASGLKAVTEVTLGLGKITVIRSQPF